MTNKMAKSPDPAKLDYLFDWSAWLAQDETITTFTVTAQTGLTITESSESAGKITAWVEGGTAGNTYRVTCTITTSAGRVDSRNLLLEVKNR